MVSPSRFVSALVWSLLAASAAGQTPGFVRWSADELAERRTALGTHVGADGSARETLGDYETATRSHRFRFIHRVRDGAPEQHRDIEDVVLIQSGAAVLQVGGVLVEPRGTPPELTGRAIRGGEQYAVAAGDILHIPADTPHRYLVPEGGQVTYVLVRMPALVGERVVPPDAPTLTFRPDGFALWRADELETRRMALVGSIRPDRSSRETLADYGSPVRSHRFRHIHRDANGVPEIHDEIIDVVFVTSGAGELLVGGEILDRNASLGSGIADGVRHPVAAGDVLHIPARTPHGYLVPTGGQVTYVLVRVPAVPGS